MSVLIEVSASDNQLIDGIPEYIDLFSNKAVLFFYTLDGSDPTEDSLVAIDRIYLPTSGAAVYLKVVAKYDTAILGDSEYSEIITLNYKTSPDIKDSRALISEGINVLGYNKESITSLGFDSSGNKTRESSNKTEDMDIVSSTVDSSGYKTAPGSSYDFINFPISVSVKSNKSGSLDNVYFDPTSKVIRVDGSTREAYDAQVVRYINRAYESVNPIKRSAYENPIKNSNLITGNLVRYAYNNATGIMVFYYFDSKDSRWTISKQKIDPKKIDFGGEAPRTRLGRYVFRWNKDPVMSKLR